MILGIGIDSTEIDRFIPWLTFSHNRLQRIFSDEEIMYCFNIDYLNTQAARFAARFAAREAFYKALCQLAPDNNIPLLTLCKKISVHHQTGASPQLIIDWSYFESAKADLKEIGQIKAHLSITHSRTVATALIILENKVSLQEKTY